MAEGTFQITINGIDALTAAFRNYPNISLPILSRAIVASQAVLASNTNANTVPFKTGALSGRFAFVALNALSASWGPTVDYAGYVEYGTLPHVILPKNRMALFWPGASNPVRAVKHPGTKANPYMERILEASEGGINDLFSQALQMILKGITLSS